MYTINSFVNNQNTLSLQLSILLITPLQVDVTLKDTDDQWYNLNLYTCVRVYILVCVAVPYQKSWAPRWSGGERQGAQDTHTKLSQIFTKSFFLLACCFSAHLAIHFGGYLPPLRPPRITVCIYLRVRPTILPLLYTRLVATFTNAVTVNSFGNV